MPIPEHSELIADLREQILFLQELGVDGLSVDLPEPQISLSSVDKYKVNVSSSLAAKSALPAEISIPKTDSRPARTGSRLSALPSLGSRVRIESPHANESNRSQSNMQKNMAANEPALIDVSPRLEETADTIESIRAEIGDCTRCKLHALGRKQIVHTTGNFQADLMFVGEAPGADEDEQGFPFVGRAGKLLTDIIVAMGFQREQVCIGNINRCRPPENRKPEPDETAACRPFILREVAVIKPKVIVVLGATAAHNLLQVSTPISKLRGNFQDYFGVKVMPTFHPAYLLRDPHKKKDVWEDMKKVRDYLSETTAS